MADHSKKILIGCGIGCAVILLIGIGIFVGGYFLIKDTVKNAEEMKLAHDNLIEKLGNADEFSPFVTQQISAERVALFLEIRDSLSGIIGKISNNVEQVDAKIKKSLEEGDKSYSGGPEILKMIFEFVPDLFDFNMQKSKLLLSKNMGIGEYQFLYSVLYYSYLQKRPGDGAMMNFDNFDKGSDGENVKIEADNEIGEQVIENRGKRIKNIVNLLFIKQLQNSLQNNAVLDKKIKGVLKEELSKLQSDINRIPWQEGLPQSIIDILVPQKEKIELSYNQYSNMLEFGNKH